MSRFEMPNVRTDRLFHVTANWQTNTNKRLTRDFLICATSKTDAEIIARNHIPKRIATYKEHIATDMQIRVRDLGISQKNRTYMMSPITETERPNPNEPSILEHTSTHFAYLFGAETQKLTQLEQPTNAEKQRLTALNQVSDKTVLCITWAMEYLYEKDIDRNVFFQKKLNQLSNTEDTTPVTVKSETKSVTTTNPQISIEQAKQQAELIIQNAKETASIIIQNAKDTAQMILAQASQTATTPVTTQPTIEEVTTEQTSEEPVSEQDDIPENNNNDTDAESVETDTNKQSDDTSNTITETDTPDEPDVKENSDNIETIDTDSIDVHLEERMQDGINWLEEFLQNDTQLTLTPDDIYTELDNKSNDDVLNELNDKTFAFETTIEPKTYFLNEIVNNTDLETSARQATKVALYHSIPSTDEDTLFQIFVKNHINQELQRLHAFDMDDGMFGDDDYEDEEENDDEPYYGLDEPPIDL